MILLLSNCVCQKGGSLPTGIVTQCLALFRSFMTVIICFFFQNKQHEILVMENKMKFMEERIRKTDSVIQSQKDFYTEKLSENTELSNKNKQLFDQLTEKGKKIAE